MIEPLVIRSRSFGRLPRDREICLYSSVNRDSTELPSDRRGIGIGVRASTTERTRSARISKYACIAVFGESSQCSARRSDARSCSVRSLSFSSDPVAIREKRIKDRRFFARRNEERRTPANLEICLYSSVRRVFAVLGEKYFFEFAIVLLTIQY